jgi:predicted amidohydrolase YtcJ
MPWCRSARAGRDYRISMSMKSTALETRTPFLTCERINLPEALAAFTINAAYTNRLEKTTGSIEVGKNADLIVLDHNLFAIPATEIERSKVLLTFFEGRAVYRDLERF